MYCVLSACGFIMVSHYGDVIMGAIASQIPNLTIVYSTLYSDADQRKYQSSSSLAFVGGSEFSAQMASNAENVSIWWRHHDLYPRNYLSIIRRFTSLTLEQSFDCQMPVKSPQNLTACILLALDNLSTFDSKKLACARAWKLTTHMYIARARCESQPAVGSSGLNAR